jgi:hypothetical protein
VAEPPKLPVWGLGLFGVNVVDSPLHLVDGELLNAQNAEPFTEEGEGGLRKRLGIGLFTGTALPAGIAAMTSVPLIDPLQVFARLIVLPRTGAGTTGRTSTNGVSWADLSLTPADRFEPNGWTVSLPHFDGRVWFPVNGCLDLQTYNGVGSTTEPGFPATITRPSDGLLYNVLLVTNAVVREGAIWWIARYASSGGNPAEISVVYRHDPESGSFTPIAQPFAAEAAAVGSPTADGLIDGAAQGLEVFQGEVYVQITKAGGSSRVYRAAPGATAWTQDDEVASSHTGGICASDDGALYVGYSSGSAARLRKRTADGTWSTVVAVGATGKVNPVHVAGDRVLAWVSDATNMRLRESTDAGGSFSTVYTEADPQGHGNSSAVTRLVVGPNGDEFLTYGDEGDSTARIIRLNSGTWSLVDSFGSGGDAALLGGV